MTQNLRKNWLVVWKVTWGIWEILTRAIESLKIATLMGSFYPKKKMYQLKIYGGVSCIMPMKNDAKFEKEMTFRFKIDTTIRRMWNYTEIIKFLSFPALLCHCLRFCTLKENILIIVFKPLFGWVGMWKKLSSTLSKSINNFIFSPNLFLQSSRLQATISLFKALSSSEPSHKNLLKRVRFPCGSTFATYPS